MKHLLLIFTLFVSGIVAFAQPTPTDANQSNPELEQTIIDFTKQFYSAYEEAVNSKSGNLEPMIKFFDRDCLLTRNIMDVNNSLMKRTANLNDLRLQAQSQMSLAGFSISFNVDRINFVTTYDNLATISYSVWVNAQLNGEPLGRYRSHVTNYIRKDSEGNWKIFESNGINVYKEQELGWCPCGVTQKNKNQYAVKILYPSGNSFDTDELTFDFKGAQQKALIIVGKNAYTLKDNEVVCVQEDGKTITKPIGRAMSEIEAISLILTNHLYLNRCAGFKAIDKK